ncbi:hypothetical protein MC885_017104, partial [Smutsia gigantea]
GGAGTSGGRSPGFHPGARVLGLEETCESLRGLGLGVGGKTSFLSQLRNPSGEPLQLLGPHVHQEALVVHFDTEGHEGPRSDVPPVPTRSHALPALGKQKSGPEAEYGLQGVALAELRGQA